MAGEGKVLVRVSGCEGESDESSSFVVSVAVIYLL